MALDRSTFGPNAWLIDEMYRQYVEDPSSVGEAWREFFEDYAPPSREAAEEQEAPPKEVRPKEEPPTARRQQAPPKEDAEAPAKPVERPAGRAREDAAPLRGVDATIAKRMEESLGVPTATSVRTVPAKLLEVNRNILNRHLARTRGAKVSFTHIIGFAIVRGLARMPGMNVTYKMVDGKPHVVRHEHVNLGLAVDVKREDGTRTLLVPNIKDADALDFAAFFNAYEELIRKVRANKLAPDDFAGTTVTITNPGTIGTVQSVPRLMAGQAAIIGVGTIDYPAEYQGADPRALAEIGVGKVLTLTSTYDHRVIQGAESGEFLGVLSRLLLGEDGFYEDIFRPMHVPYVAVEWRRDVNPPPESLEHETKKIRVQQLINLYRVRGHLIAHLDPLEAEPPSMHPELDPATYGLTIWDLDRAFPAGGLAGRDVATLGEILGILRDAYCRTASVEYMHIQEHDQKSWIQDRVEGVAAQASQAEQKRILRKLNQAEAFERFMHQKYVGHKRFSLEGAETLIPILDTVLEGSADAGLDEVVLGMAHRGRLNVLANVVGKSYTQIFREFEGDIDPAMPQGSGDVMYHVGAAGTHRAESGKEIAVSMASNPSHLEAVDPVVEGMARGQQDRLDRREEFPVLPVLVHGDAAFAGQGVVAETLNFSQLAGYGTGGTVHIIVNNQLGFTTGSSYARSSTYASDVAKTIQAPIFHVNGDDPEACVHVTRLAFAFRQAFHKDVVIDMWCYRRWGHNETDDPALTQPLMYARIENRRSVRKLYTETLVNRGDLTVEDAERFLEEFQDELKRAFDETRGPSKTPALEWKRPAAFGPIAPVETGVGLDTLRSILDSATSVPEGFSIHKRLEKWLEARRRALGEDAVDWALGETLAWGSLLLEGTDVRLSGQDSRRGTFSQRHSVLVDQKTGAEHAPLAHIPGARGRFLAYDSLLSEYAVVGFEYGYSVAAPDSLVMWEAQFGDFVNGAQIVIDGFIAAAEDKWGQTSRLVLLLPHGYEGQGPEHSSARLERFLDLGAEDNIQVVAPTTPAQYFHVLRRQVRQDVAKPLITLTPKSLLRHPAARSPTDAFTSGRFRKVLADPAAPEPAEVSRVILCQGKIFYELAQRREEGKVGGAALVRVEQLYPFPAERIKEQLDCYAGADEVFWVQEEPENMGAWRFMHLSCERRLGVDLSVVAREESASPATGSRRIHEHEQNAILDQAFAGLKADGK